MKHLNKIKNLLLLLLVLGSSQAAFAVTSGVYTVGTGGFFPDLAAALSDLNTSTITGPVIYSITPGSYSGPNWQMQLNGITGSSATNTVTFQAQTPGTVSITATGISTANYVFQLNNVNYVFIKNLTLINNSTTSFGVVVQLSAACSNDSIVNCTLTAPVTTTVTNDAMAVVHLGYSGTNVLSGSNNTVKGNTISGGSIGVTVAGTSTALTNNNIIDNNTISGNYTYGLYVNNAGAFKARGNTINGTSAGYNSAMFLTATANGLDVSSNTVSINVTTTISGGVYGINNSYTNATTPSTTAVTQINNNNVTVAVTTGISTPLSNGYSTNLTLNGNTFTGTTTTGQVNPPQLMYYCVTSSASGNTFNCTASSTGSIASGTWNFMSFCNQCTVRNNTFNNTTTSGSIFSGSFNFMNNVTNGVFTKNTFNVNSTSGGLFTYGSTYQWFCTANNANCDSNLWNITSTTGQIGTTASSTTMGFSNNAPAGSVISMSNNKFNITSANTSTSYGFWGYYPAYGMGAATALVNSDTININFTGANTFFFWGYYGPSYGANTSPGTTWQFTNNIWTCNAPNGTSTFSWLCYYYFGYYSLNSKFNNNTLIVNTTSGTVYALGVYYFGYYSTGMQFRKNTVTVNSTSASAASIMYYFGYYSNNFVCDSNTFNVTAGSGTAYNPYYWSYYNNGSKYTNNIFNSTVSTGTVYSPYFYSYYASGSRYSNNTFNITATSSGSAYAPYYPNYYGSADTVETSTWNVSLQNGTFYDYNYFLTNLTRNNTWNVSTTSGSIYNYMYYCNGGTYSGNKHNYTTTTGTIYGMYDYVPSTGYTGNTVQNNKFDLRSTSGAIYGYAVNSYNGGSKYIGNLITTSTTGSSYLFYFPSGNYQYNGDVYFVNNTFHSNSTGGTNYMLYHLGGTSSYPNKTYMFNNIFSRTASVATAGSTVAIGDTSYFRSDYNLYYTGGTPSFTSTTPSVTATSLQAWKVGSKRELNSIYYDPGFMSPSGFDFRPDPANPNSWSVQGRGNHFPGDTTDILGNPRAKSRFQGVPDLGAYEFTPTSTPPDAVASPATPVASANQVFTFGTDTVCTIQWGSSVPTTASVKQYTGLQAGPMPLGTGRMYFFDALSAPTGTYDYKPLVNYKDAWVGDITTETNAKIAQSINGHPWVGYNFANGPTDTVKNLLMPLARFDTLSSTFTGVENARIGIRCVVAPSGLTHSLIGADSAVEAWDPVFSPIGYQLIVNNTVATPTLPYTGLQFSGSNVYNIKALNEDTKYYVHIRSICGVKDTSGWAVDSFTTLPRCHAPILHVNAITDVRAVVYWDTVRLGASYEYVIDQSSSDPAFGTMTVNRSVLATGLTPATTYFAHVRSYCNNIYNISIKADGITPDWSIISFTTRFPASVTNSAGPTAGMYIYPNPVKDVVTIQLNEKADGAAQLSVTDVTGKVLRNVEVTGQKIELDMTSIPAGMYLLKYTDRSRTEISKISKD